MLVTGASRGIGAATALLGAARGYTVAVNYVRDEAAALSVCARIEAAGGDGFAVQADVANEDDVLAMFAALDARGLPLTALVNNAGVVGRVGAFVDYSAARLKRTFDVNIYGAFLIAREALKRMSTAHGGRGGAIVNLSSAAARIGSPNEFIDYAASKGAIDSMRWSIATNRALAAAADVEKRAGDIGRLVGQQPQDSLRHFFGLAGALHGNHGGETLHAIGRAGRGVNFSVDEARAHSVDAHAVAREFLAQAQSHAVDGALGRGIVDELIG